MKLYIFALLALIPLTARADEPQTRPSPTSAYIEVIRHGLSDVNLSDDQRSKIEAILAQAEKDVRELVSGFEKGNVSADDRRAKLREFGMDLRSRIEPLLGDLQKQEMADKINLLRQGGTALAMRIGERLYRIGEQLQLVDSQKAKFRALVDEVVKKLSELKGNPDEKEVILKVLEAHWDAVEKLKDILSKEQLLKFKELYSRPQPASEPANP